MTPTLHDALPLATTSAFTPLRLHVHPHAGPWQTAFARAATACEAAAPTAARPVAAEPAQGKGRSAPAAPSRDVTTGNIPRSVQAQRIAGDQRATPVPASQLSDSGVVASQPDPLATVRWSSAPLAIPETRDAVAPPRLGPSSSLASEAYPTTRIHVEQNEHEGMTVWLGADGDAAAVALKAVAVLAELQRALPLAGHRLARLVCNGIPVYIAPDFEKETS